jgi:hypothetical protein
VAYGQRDANTQQEGIDRRRRLALHYNRYLRLRWMALPPDDDQEFIPLPDKLPPSAEPTHRV